MVPVVPLVPMDCRNQPDEKGNILSFLTEKHSPVSTNRLTALTINAIPSFGTQGPPYTRAGNMGIVLSFINEIMSPISTKGLASQSNCANRTSATKHRTVLIGTH